MTSFYKFIYVSALLFILMLLFLVQKINKIRERFADVFHITDAKTFKYDKISVNPDSSYVNDPTKDDKGMYFNNIYVDFYNKLFVGKTAVTETGFNLSDLLKIKRTQFPYIKKTSNGERLHFNGLDDKYYLDADNLRALQGKQLVPLYNNTYGTNKYALKMEPQRDSFETGGLKCGFAKDAVYSQKNITGIIPSNKEY